MKQIGPRLLASLLLVGLFGILAFGQGITSSSLGGVVKDPQGGVIAGAMVNVKNQATNQELNTTTAENGTYNIPSVPPGIYTVTITATGFKKAFTKDVAVDVGTAANVNLSLVVGTQDQIIEVVGSGEVLQTETTNVSSTITGRQIQTLPLASRNALDLVLFLPGTATVGGERQSTINGLPRGAINMEIDGINTQDNLLKSSDGFFTFIRPSVDAVAEVSVSTATPGAESAGEGAVQIKFVTKSGSNDWHGAAYEYLRNPALNANYFFNNRDLPPNPGTGEASRTRVVLNQFGFALGGPIIKDKFFFFVNYEEYRLPEQSLRSRTILNPASFTGSTAGTFFYNNTSVNIFNLAAAFNAANPTKAPLPTTLDPTVSSLLNSIASATANTSILPLADPQILQSNFINTGGQKRRYPTVRFDINLTSKHHLESIYNFQRYNTAVDFLNNADPVFPGFPNFGGQDSSRFSESTALRSTLSNTLVNEARFGLTGGTVVFDPTVNVGQFANQGGLSLGISAADGISNPTAVINPQRRNTPVWQFNDTLSYTRGTHTMNFGYTFTQINLFSENLAGGIVPQVTFGISSLDTTAASLFTAANFPGASTTQLNTAGALYATLVGRVTAVNQNAFLDEKTGQFANENNQIQRGRQREMGWFAQDAWRLRPNLTINYGLRYEIEYPFKPTNPLFSLVSYSSLFGVSGAGNYFQPGNQPGSPTMSTAFDGNVQPFKTDYGAFAPSLGFAYQPNFKDGILRKIFGDGGQTVIRAGASIAYDRDGLALYTAVLGGNGGTSINTAKSVAGGTLPVGTQLQSGVTGTAFAPVLTPIPTFPFTPGFTDSARAFIPNLKTPYVPSWTFGIQRELNKDTVLEVRYVGNRALRQYNRYSINEVNTVESGFFNEFLLAQQNLAANNAAGGSRAGSFAYFGSGTGTAPLPIIWAYFTDPTNKTVFPSGPTGGATNAANYTSASFKSGTFVNALSTVLPNVTGFAGTLATTLTNVNNAKNNLAGGFTTLPANLFLANPQIAGGNVFLTDNSGRESYDAGVVEVRRRLSKGLLVQGSYTFSKALGNQFAANSQNALNQPDTLRNRDLNKSLSPFDITHGFKMDWIYELPVGQGKAFLNSENKIVSRLVSGWEWDGTARIQSGSPIQLGNVQLVGITSQQLEAMIRPYSDVARSISTGLPTLNSAGKTTPVEYFLPFQFIQNTVNAFNGKPPTSGAYIAPTNLNQPNAFAGQFGYGNLVLHGPHFTRFDMSAVKRTTITERVKFEFRAEFLNAFNTPNFIVGNPANVVNTATNFSSNAFGQITQAYRDTNQSNDPGGRLVQFVARFTF